MALLQLYNFVIGPFLILAANGYWPDFSYQRIPLHELTLFHGHLLRAIALLVQNVLLVAGGNWYVPGALTIGSVMALMASHRRGKGHVSVIGTARLERVLKLFAWIAAAQILMFALMIARHGYVYRWIDHRYWYYPLPFLALVIVGTLLCLDAWFETISRRGTMVVRAIMMIVVVSNLLSLSLRRDVMVTGGWFGNVYVQSELLKGALRTRTPDPRLDWAYAELYEHRVAQLPKAAEVGR